MCLQPPIHVMVGSASDAKRVKKYLGSKLNEIGVPYTFSVGSAHRDPDEVRADVLATQQKGTKLFICVAGLTNGLAGTVAAHARSSRVIGVPLDREEGLDSILSMPPGVPLFLVGVGDLGLIKAAEAACLLLYESHPEVAAKWDAYVAAMKVKKPPTAHTNINLHVPRDTLHLVIEGKTKRVLDLEDGTVLVVSKDDITAGDGARHDVMTGKAVSSNLTTCNVFECLEAADVPTHYVGRHDSTSLIARRMHMIPIEVVMRGTVFGSYLERYPDATEFDDFGKIVVEFFEKDDDKHDPLLVIEGQRVERHDAHAPLGSAFLGNYPDDMAWTLIENREELERIGRLVFETLKAKWAALGHKLVDLKIEFGWDAEKGELVVADVIDNDSWRVWLYGDPKQQVDKQVYRDLGLDEPDTAMRIKGNYALVAELTAGFVSA